MGLGKTITCVSLIAATLDSSLRFAATPLSPPEPPPESCSSASMLSASHFAGSVWGMPDTSQRSSSTKSKAKQKQEHDKLEAEYIRACRIKTKSRATLIVCPLSTVVNWEDQFREHWRGEVHVVGGAGSTMCTSSAATSTSGLSTPTSQTTDLNGNANGKVRRIRDGKSLRVYVYHGNTRRPDPTFLADFDAVITTYSTLASEFSKQTKSIANAEEDEEEENESDTPLDVDESGNPVLKLPKAKKAGMKKRKKGSAIGNGVEATSPLQSIHWFRVVLDEAQ